MVNTIRLLAVDAVQAANSGHPGAPMGCAPMAYTIWSKFMNFNPSSPNWVSIPPPPNPQIPKSTPEFPLSSLILLFLAW